MEVNEFVQNSCTREKGLEVVRSFSNAIFVHKISKRSSNRVLNVQFRRSKSVCFSISGTF